MPYPSAPPLSEYYWQQDEDSGGGYEEIPIPPPPRLPLPDLPPPPYPPREPFPLVASVGGLIGDAAANFDLPGRRVKKHQARPHRSFNPLILHRRSCTDLFCYLLFVLFLGAWGVVAVFSFKWGNPDRLIHPTDSLGRTCGHLREGAYDLRSKPYLLFFDLTKCVSYVTVLTGCPTPQLCVEHCPTNYFSYLQLQSYSSAALQAAVQANVYCQDSVDKNTITSFAVLKQYVDAGWCTAYTVKSAAVLGRCMPQVFIDVPEAVAGAGANASLDQISAAYTDLQHQVPSDAVIRNSTKVLDGVVNSRAVLQKLASDLSVCWYQILALFGVTAVVALLWTFVVKLLGGFVIWASIFVLLGLLGGGAGYCWFRFLQLRNAGAINDFSFQPVFSLYFEMPTTWMVIAIILSALLVIVFVIFLFVRSRIKLAVAVIQETSRALGCMLSTLFFPIFPFALHIVVFALWGTVAIWLASSGEENCRTPVGGDLTTLADGIPCDCDLLGTPAGLNCHYVNYTRETNYAVYMQLYNLFACFWMSCFVGAVSDITLAGAFASYYWAFRKPKDVPSFPVIRSLGRAFRYHLGSLAFGSLILAIVKFVRAVLDFLYQKLHASENKVARVIYTALKCLFFCLEAVLRALTKNAYIMMAIYGKGFCRSARDSFSLLTRNFVRTLVLGRVVTFLMFVGKATITAGMGAIAFFYFSGRWIIDGFPQVTLYYYFVPIIIVVVGSYLICDLFFQVFEMGVDTIFLCFLEDNESNDGSTAKPYYMSEKLKQIYGKENKF